jgi:hypothetical protein
MPGSTVKEICICVPVFREGIVGTIAHYAEGRRKAPQPTADPTATAEKAVEGIAADGLPQDRLLPATRPNPATAI